MKAKPKNKEQRNQYFLDPANWEMDPDIKVRAMRLIGTNIIRIETFGLEWSFGGSKWVELGVYQYNDKGELASIYSLFGGHLDKAMMREFQNEKSK